MGIIPDNYVHGRTEIGDTIHCLALSTFLIKQWKALVSFGVWGTSWNSQAFFGIKIEMILYKTDVPSKCLQNSLEFCDNLNNYCTYCSLGENIFWRLEFVHVQKSPCMVNNVFVYVLQTIKSSTCINKAYFELIFPVYYCLILGFDILYYHNHNEIP